jgi:uncharacterized membrane protein (DUF106 family)
MYIHRYIMNDLVFEPKRAKFYNIGLRRSLRSQISTESGSRRPKYRTALSEALSFTVLMHQTITQDAVDTDSKGATSGLPVVIWYIFSSFGILYVLRKIWQPCAALFY